MNKNKYPGVYANNSSISMLFNYLGKQVKKTYKIMPTPRNLLYVYNEKVKILELIEKGDFDLEEFRDNKRNGSELSSQTYTFEDMYQEFELSYGSEKAPSTMYGYRKLAKCIAISVGKKPMDSISPSELRKVLKTNYKNCSIKYISEMINVWRKAHDILTQKLKTTRYQTSEFTGLKSNAKKPDPYTKEEIYVIFDNIETFSLTSLALTLSIATGLRPGELASLALEDLDMLADPPTLSVNRTLTVGGQYKTPKSDSSLRTIELSQFALNVINAILPLIFNQAEVINVLQKDYQTLVSEKVTFLFTNTDGGRFKSTGNLTKRIAASFKNELQFLNIKYKPLRFGRQSFATFCLEMGATFMSVAKELGHRDQRILEEHYSSAKHADPTHKVLNQRYNRDSKDNQQK
ncbi:tyrosine-type recombinase/integrase [Vibrio cholerae]|nr:tyrosine-type recombinase/integrase [Vibrio cholerae]EGQ8531070.1 tyrosine-type recombinase/integrase [Vibrio cholerae]